MRLNHATFNAFFVIVAAIIVAYFATATGPDGARGVLGNTAGIVLNLAIWIVFWGGVSYFLLGPKFNVPEEIIVNKNLPLAVFLGAIILGAAWVVAKGLL